MCTVVCIGYVYAVRGRGKCGWMSARHEYVGGTHGSGIVSNAADVLGISLMRGMKGVGVVCEMCMCLARGCVAGGGGGD